MSMIFKTLIAVSILLNSILINIEWKRIENLPLSVRSVQSQETDSEM